MKPEPTPLPRADTAPAVTTALVSPNGPDRTPLPTTLGVPARAVHEPSAHRARSRRRPPPTSDGARRT